METTNKRRVLQMQRMKVALLMAPTDKLMGLVVDSAEIVMLIIVMVIRFLKAAEAFACRRCPAKCASNTKLHHRIRDRHAKKPKPPYLRPLHQTLHQLHAGDAKFGEGQTDHHKETVRDMQPEMVNHRRAAKQNWTMHKKKRMKVLRMNKRTANLMKQNPASLYALNRHIMSHTSVKVL